MRLDRNLRPRMSLDHIIKERYPTFQDALRDLDDALTMLFLFANLPSTTAVPPKTIALCQRLTLEFEHYLISARCLRKSFLSIKGIYYQAVIQGQEILWLVPYRFVQKITGDVDLRIMGTFIEFYTTLLGFVNFRLYTSIGLVYPPKFSRGSDDQGGDLSAFTLEGAALGAINGTENPSVKQTEEIKETSKLAQAEADKLIGLADPEENQKDETNITSPTPTNAEREADMTFDKFEAVADDADVLPQPDLNITNQTSIFEPFTFYLSRETPRGPLEFLLKAFGCKRVGWDSVLGDGAYTTDESDSRITHQIVDRPSLPSNSLHSRNGDNEPKENELPSQTPVPSGNRVPGRTYVQPQWVWDSVNAGELQRPDLYAPGATLPPHLSPWAKPKKGQYDPSIPLAEQEPEGEAERALETEHAVKSAVTNATATTDDQWTGFDDEADGAHNAHKVKNTEIEEEEDEEDEEEENEEVNRQKELQAEAAGLPYTNNNNNNNNNKSHNNKRQATKDDSTRQKASQRQREKQRAAEAEELDRKRMMMSSKKRKMLDRMMAGSTKRNAEAEKLRAKKRRLEAGEA